MREDMREKSGEIAKKAAEIVERRGDGYVTMLVQLLHFETVSGQQGFQEKARFQKEVRRCVRFLEKSATELGMTYRTYDNLAAVAELEGEPGGPVIGVAVHLDVVPPGKDWTVPAFEGKVSDGFVWGRGAQDDKGPAAAIFSALDVIRAIQREESRLRQRATIRLLLGTREETDEWPDMDLLARSESTPDFVVVPDGAFPVVNAEKGMVNLELTAAWPVALPEKPDVRIKLLEGGERATTVADRAVLRLESLDNDHLMQQIAKAEEELKRMRPSAELTVREVMVEEPEDHVEVEIVFAGRAAHAAFPERGQNALLDALAFLLQLTGTPAHPVHFAEKLWQGFRHLDGSGLGLDHIHPYMGKTTVNLGMARFWEGGAKAEINVRFPAGLDGDRVERKLREHFELSSDEAINVEVTTEPLGRVQAPVYLDPEKHHDLLDPLTAAYESVTGRSGGFVAMRGTTYAKAFPVAAAFGPMDPAGGDMELAHEADERVSVTRYLENVSIYATALLLLAFDLEP